MNNYLILINKQSKLVAIEAPEKPEVCGMESGFSKAACCETNQCKSESYNKALQSAIDDESKHIPFRDEQIAFDLICKHLNISPPEILDLDELVGQTFHIPEVWRLRVEDDCQRFKDPAHLGGGVKCSERCYFKNGGLKVCEKLAILEKTSERVEKTNREILNSVITGQSDWIKEAKERVEHSVFRQVEDGFIGTHYGVTKPEKSEHSFTEGRAEDYWADFSHVNCKGERVISEANFKAAIRKCELTHLIKTESEIKEDLAIEVSARFLTGKKSVKEHDKNTFIRGAMWMLKKYFYPKPTAVAEPVNNIWGDVIIFCSQIERFGEEEIIKRLTKYFDINRKS